MQLRKAKTPSTRALPLLPARGQFLQRKCACAGKAEATEGCAECLKKQPLQRRAVSTDEQTGAPFRVREVLQSPGQPLDSRNRAFMETYFGHDFSHVRVHTDARVAESASEVGALAYTAGDQIVFGSGQYAPRSSKGIELLAHELAHVIQQRSGRAIGEHGVGSPQSAYEREADRFAERVSRMISQTRIFERSSPSPVNFLTKGTCEAGDTETSVEPPDPRFLYQNNGETTCTFPAGTPSTNISNADCARPCTVRHEGIHSADISPCCAAAGRAHAAAATVAAKTAVENSFFTWMASNRSWFECRAYAESVRCADGMVTAKHCSSPAPADAACCGTLASYRSDKETRRASNCAAAAANLSACPFP
jgi:hypothetical protein